LFINQIFYILICFFKTPHQKNKHGLIIHFTGIAKSLILSANCSFFLFYFIFIFFLSFQQKKFELCTTHTHTPVPAGPAFDFGLNVAREKKIKHFKTQKGRKNEILTRESDIIGN